jgi:hypothetical protein
MLVSQVTTELGMSRHVKIYRFGAATNCFSVLAGLLMKGEPCENSLFLLDGDVYRHAGDRQTQIERACSGNDPAADSHRTEMAIRIQDFELPPDHKPESYLHRLIVTQDPATLGPQETEIQKAAKEIVNPLDGHGFIYHLLTVLGENRAVQLTRVVPLAAKHEDWAAYTQPVRTWLQQRKAAMHLQ